VWSFILSFHLSGPFTGLCSGAPITRFFTPIVATTQSCVFGIDALTIKRIGVHHRAARPHREHLQIGVDQRRGYVLAFPIEIDQFHSQRRILRDQLPVLEIVEAIHVLPEDALGYDHRPLEPRRQVVQDAAQRIGVRGRQLLDIAGEVGLDENVLLAFERRSQFRSMAISAS